MVGSFGLWTPENTQPQITEEAHDETLALLLAEGLDTITRDGLAILEADHEPLAEYLDRLSFELNHASTEGFWPERVVKFGAAVSIIAYRASGYFQLIDENDFIQGSQVAIRNGIPESYIISAISDSKLTGLVETLQETSLLSEGRLDSRDQGGYAQVTSIGAGCVRHYLQQAVEQAA
jgi:hypothetical protein